MLFDYIKASKFFPVYAAGVTNWKHKLRKLDGNGKPIDFSDEDRVLILAGFEKLRKNIYKKSLDKMI